MTKRREFLKTGAYLAAGTLILPMGCGTGSKETETAAAEVAKETVKRSKLAAPGFQIYSVRDALNMDFEGTVSQLADIGYKNVEIYGMNNKGQLFNMDPAEYARIVSDNGMRVVATHTDYFEADEVNAFIDAGKAAGVEWIIIPYTPDDKRADWLQVADNFNKIGEAVKGAGMKFGYHNHAFEFESDGGELPFDILLNNTDPELVKFEMDLYWVTKGGQNPMDYIKKYPGRFCSYHVKDATAGDMEQTTLGTGIIDFPALLKARDEAGIEYYFVEDERTDDPIGNMEANFKYISTTDFS